MEDIKISILMPVFNAEMYLNECLTSVINQLYTNWELIAINDFCTDNSIEILKKYEAADDRIKVFQNRQKGIIPALQLAYRLSKGELISRMDADDIMPIQKLQFLVKALNNENNAVATGFVKYFAENGVGAGYKKYEQWLNTLVQNENNFSGIYKECVIPSPCWLISKCTLNKIGAFNYNIYPEDYDLCFRMYEHKLKVKNVKEVCHLWRDHSSRASRNDEHYANNSFLQLKCHYFLTIDYTNNKELVLWGAGNKGKQIAKYLKQKDVPFTWVCDNENKIGHSVYEKKLQHYSAIKLNGNKQFIIAVANEAEQNKIKVYLKNEAFYFFT